MLKLGLTGCAGSGKSEAAKVFSALSVHVIDADRIARQLVAPGQTCYQLISQHFGADVCIKNGQLDRRWLRTKMLADKASKQTLEKILHPPIREQLIAASCKIEAQAIYCVLMVPLLIESSMIELVDRVLVLDCKKETCIKRLCQRDHCSRHQARALIEEQMPPQERLQFAHFVVDNNADRKALARHIKELHQKLISDISNEKTSKS